MAYDIALAERIRQALAGQTGIVEKAMFGGIAFLLNGNMCVGVSKTDLMVRVDPSGPSVLEEPHTRVFDMTGRPMKGWVLVSEKGTATPDGLQTWIRRGMGYAGTLPPK